MSTAPGVMFNVSTFEIKLLYSLNHHKEDEHATTFWTSVH